MEFANGAMIQEIREWLSLLDSIEALELLPPKMLEDLHKAVVAAGRLIRCVYETKEVLEPVPSFSSKPTSIPPVTSSSALAFGIRSHFK